MSNSSVLASITYEAEASWAEDVNTFATHRIPTSIPVDVTGLVHEKLPSEFTEQYRGAGHAYFLGVMGGSFKMRLWLTGHGATMAGSPTVDAVETFLGIVFGNVDLSLTTSDTITGGTASVPTTTGASGVDAGGLVRIGSLGDADGDGQMYPVATHASNNLTMLAALRAAPAAAQVVYPVFQFYTNSSPTSTSITGTRFQILTANTQYNCHGCYPLAIAFTGLAPGERPAIEITWGVSRWIDTDTDTFPSTVTSNRYQPAPVAAGSLHVQDVGTVTRNELVCRNFSIEYNLGIVPQKGTGGVGIYQDTVGAFRTGDESCTVTFTVDSSAAGTVTLPGWGRGTTNRFIMYTLSATNGSAVGFKFPKVCSTTVPTQHDMGGINRMTFTGQAYTSDTLTSELTRARMVMGYA